MTTRAIPSTLAALLQQMELEQPRVVSMTDLCAWAVKSGVTGSTEWIVRRLRERGWLLDLKTRGVWEFAPAARAGAYGSGDPLIELRATLERDHDAPFTAAEESAAYLLGLTSRRPGREVIGAPPGVRIPTALEPYRIARWTPSTKLVERDGLPVWAVSTLIASMGAVPSNFHDWPNAGEWLPSAIRELSADEIEEELRGRPRAAWARTAYLLDRGGRSDLADALLSHAPAGTGPFYLGRRHLSGLYDSKYDVVDSTGMEVGGE
jgi:hypothetical protein